MKIACPLFSTILEIRQGEVFSLIIEEHNLFRKFIEDIRLLTEGGDGQTVISENDSPIRADKYVDLIDSFAPFDINTKSLLNAINTRLEEKATDETNYLKSAELISAVENYLMEISFDFPFRTEWRKLSIQSIIKAASVSVADDYESSLEAILDYMTVMTDLNHKKLFVTVNLRNYFNDEDVFLFADTVRKKQFRLLMLESHTGLTIQGCKQLIIDGDLCEI